MNAGLAADLNCISPPSQHHDGLVDCGGEHE